MCGTRWLTIEGLVEQTLGLGDTMNITKLEGGTQDILSCNVEEVPLDGKNLIVKGFDLFRQRTGSSVLGHMRLAFAGTSPLQKDAS